MAYQSYAKGGSFAPKETTTYLPALRENQKRIREGEDAYFDQMRRNDQTRIKNAERAGDGLKALGEFSKSLSTTLKDVEKRKAEQDQADGLAMAYSEGMYGEGSPERAALDAGEEQLKTADAALNITATEVLAGNPENYGAAHKVKELSGWKEYGYAMGKAQMAGMQYTSWMQNALATDDQTEVVIGDQRFTPATAKTPEQKAAAMSILRTQFNREMGVVGINPTLLAKYMFQEMYQGDAKIMGQARKEFAVEQSFQDQTEAFAAFESDKDLSGLLTRVSSTVGGNGQLLGYRGAWSQVMGRLEDMYKAGRLSELDLQAMEAQIQPGTGKTFGELHGTKFASLRRNIQDFEQADWERDQGFKELEWQKAEVEIIEQLQSQENITEADIEAAEAALNEIYPGKNSQRLNDMSGDMTVESKAMDLQEEQIKQLADGGLLTPDRLSKFHWTLQRKYQDVARNQGQVSQASKGYEKNIEDDIKKIAGVTSTTAKDGTVGIAVAVAQNDYRAKVSKYMAAGMSAEEATLQAYSDLRKEYTEGSKDDKDGTNDSSKWLLRSGGFVNLIPKADGAENVIKKFQNEVTQIRAQITAGARIGETKGLIFDDKELSDIESSYGRPGFEMPQKAIYWASQLASVSDPLAIINQQRKAYGLPPMEIPPAIETVRQNVDPELRSLLNRYKAPERSARALGSMAKYEPSIVPGGYGDHIAEIGDKYGIPPSILAGLIETESGWNPNAISPSGARGLGQFMPDTAQQYGLNVNDPLQSIEMAARYLRDIMDGRGTLFNRQVDLETAIYMYNAGPNYSDLATYPLPGENAEYLPKVMQSAYKYGYGQLPVRAAFK